MGIGIEYSSTLEPRLVSNALVNEKLSTQVINKTEQSVATQIHSRGRDDTSIQQVGILCPIAVAWANGENWAFRNQIIQAISQGLSGGAKKRLFVGSEDR
jgi:hypothetical protein